MAKQIVVGGKTNKEVYANLDALAKDTSNEGAIVLLTDYQPRSNVQQHSNGAYPNTRMVRLTRGKEKGEGRLNFEPLGDVRDIGIDARYHSTIQTLEIDNNRVFLPSATTERAGLLDALTLQKIANNQRALSYAALGKLPRIRRATASEEANLVVIRNGLGDEVLPRRPVSSHDGLLRFGSYIDYHAYAIVEDYYAFGDSYSNAGDGKLFPIEASARLAEGSLVTLVFEVSLNNASGGMSGARVRFIKELSDPPTYVEVTARGDRWTSVAVETRVVREEDNLGVRLFAPWLLDYISTSYISIRNVKVYAGVGGGLLGDPIGVAASSITSRNYLLRTSGEFMIGGPSILSWRVSNELVNKLRSNASLPIYFGAKIMPHSAPDAIPLTLRVAYINKYTEERIYSTHDLLVEKGFMTRATLSGIVDSNLIDWTRGIEVSLPLHNWSAMVSELFLMLDPNAFWSPAVEDIEQEYLRLRSRFSLVYFEPNPLSGVRVSRMPGMGHETLTLPETSMEDIYSRVGVVLLDKDRNFGYLHWQRGEFFPASLDIKEPDSYTPRVGEQFLEVIKPAVAGDIDSYQIIEFTESGDFMPVTLYE